MKNLLKTLLCVAVAGVVTTGCGTTEESTRGTVRMALTTTNASTTYRLVGATFAITGPENQTVSPAPAQQFFQIDLAAGDYTIVLQDGWSMESSVDGGPYAPVNAVLAGPASQAFTIHDQELTYVRYSFRAGADVMVFGDGRLVLEIAVNEGSDGNCAVTPGSCGNSVITCSGHVATLENTCRISAGPSGTTLSCNGVAATIPSGFGATPNGYGDALRRLATLQRLLLEYFESHGRFPPFPEAFTPAVTCCGAPGSGVTECPANANAWGFGSAWDELGFSIDVAHPFVYSYAGNGGDTAQVIARGDLDCDFAFIDYDLSCSQTNGNPSCTLTLPALCSGTDYE